MLFRSRDRQEAVLLECIGYFLLVIHNVYIDDILVHQIPDLHIVVGYDEGPEGYDTQQLSAGVLDITGVDRLAVHPFFFDVRQRFRHGHIFSQADIIRRHQASGARFRIIQECVDEPALFLCGLLQNLIHHVGRKFLQHVDHIVEEINQRLYEEVDYTYEAKNVLFFGERLNHPHVVIPKVYPELSTSKVLVCSYIEGKSFGEFLTSSPSQEVRNHFAQLLFDTFFTSLYQLKAIHADPNPGNFIFMDNDRLGLIDFGCIKYVDDDFLIPYNRLHLSLIEECDDLSIAKQYAALNMIDSSDDASMVAFYNEVIKPLDRLYIDVLTKDYYDFGNDHSFSKRGFDTILEVQKKQTHSVHKFNQEYLFLNRTLLGYYTMFEQLGARIDTRSAREIMNQYQGENHG